MDNDTNEEFDVDSFKDQPEPELPECEQNQNPVPRTLEILSKAVDFQFLQQRHSRTERHRPKRHKRRQTPSAANADGESDIDYEYRLRNTDTKHVGHKLHETFHKDRNQDLQHHHHHHHHHHHYIVQDGKMTVRQVTTRETTTDDLTDFGNDDLPSHSRPNIPKSPYNLDVKDTVIHLEPRVTTSSISIPNDDPVLETSPRTESDAKDHSIATSIHKTRTFEMAQSEMPGSDPETDSSPHFTLVFGRNYVTIKFNNASGTQTQTQITVKSENSPSEIRKSNHGNKSTVLKRETVPEPSGTNDIEVTGVTGDPDSES